VADIAGPVVDFSANFSWTSATRHHPPVRSVPMAHWRRVRARTRPTRGPARSRIFAPIS